MSVDADVNALSTDASAEPARVSSPGAALAVGEQAPVLELEPIAYVRHISDAELLTADVHERRRAAEWSWDIWWRVCLVKVGSHRTEELAAETADQHVAVFHLTRPEVHALLAAVAAGRIPMPEPVARTRRERWTTYAGGLRRCRETTRTERPARGDVAVGVPPLGAALGGWAVGR
ncbi:hypothetical protein [Kitasatospora purpeofusca]|uniref:hypothetical protein n=1 Tax=Kitasatospora purpeofusca TaxID=67352 RepID=UPI002A5A5A20|nr:hypothetical protein [Kitasatospora purpeofusca]MDY0814830.1 hypothetical protein [Kitasatospora purpeofusca]